MTYFSIFMLTTRLNNLNLYQKYIDIVLDSQSSISYIGWQETFIQLVLTQHPFMTVIKLLITDYGLYFIYRSLLA